MTGRIPQEFINDILARVDIIDIIQSRMKITKRGQNHHGLCPFHQEKTPSFTANQNKQFYYCFGCSASGNALGFVMKYDQLSFREAVEQLANKAGLEIPCELDHSQQPELTALYQITEKAATYYEQQLRQHPDAIHYLKSRGLTGEIAKTFRVGYIQPGWTNLCCHLNQSEHLITTGLANQKDNRMYDRFRHRIMFPIRDTRGRIVGFGGRSIDNTPPKYLNSPETTLFHKNNELFGLYEARKSNSKLPFLLVTEGYMDVIALHQHNITQAVATLGTAINKKHLHKLLRHTSTLIFCFDGDNAGQTAAWKALCISLPFLRDGVCIKIFSLPKQHDPDSLVRSAGADEFNQSLEQAPEITTLLFSNLETKHPSNTLSGKAQFAKTAMELINTMPTGIYKQLLMKKLSEYIAIPLEDIDKLLIENNKNQQQNHTKKATETATAPQPATSTPPTLALTTPLSPYAFSCVILTQDPGMVNEIDKSAIDQLPHADYFWLHEIIRLITNTQSTTTGQLIAHCTEEFKSQITQLAQLTLTTQQEHKGMELKGAIRKVLHQSVQNEINSLIKQAKRNSLSPSQKERLQQLLLIKTK